MSFNFMLWSTPSSTSTVLLANPKYLCITSAALIIPFAFYMNNAVYRFFEFPNNNAGYSPSLESGLATILFIAMYAAQAFWYNPVKYSFLHKLDGIIAKLAIGLFLIYVIFYKERWRDPMFVISVIGLFYFAAMSHCESSKEWCCPSHLFYHGGLHLISAGSAIYAFIE